MSRPFGSIGRVPAVHIPEQRSGERHRWTMRVHDTDGHDVVIVVQAHDGKVYGQAGDVAIEYEPADISRLRELLQRAQVAALWQRGEW